VLDGKLSLPLWKKLKQMKKNFHWKILQSLSFGFETFWIETLVPCRFVGGSGLIAFTFDLLARDFVVGTSICVKQGPDAEGDILHKRESPSNLRKEACCHSEVFLNVILLRCLRNRIQPMELAKATTRTGN
jgi:hypothetical protein